MERLKVASLFSGCGGMDLGMLGGFKFLEIEYSRNPIDIVYAIDDDKFACEIYNVNFEHKCIKEDIRKVKADDIPFHHVLTGGFPCQSFSIVAQNPPRLGYNDENGRLFFEMCRVLKEKKPLCFIAENVKGILSVNNGQAFPLILRNFEDAGYYARYGLLDASGYGVPQRRQRVFIIGFRNLETLLGFDFPTPTNEKIKVPLSRVILPENEVNEKYYFSEKAVNGMERAKEKMNKGRAQDPSKPCNTIGAHLAKVSLNGTDPVLKTDGRYRMFTPREAANIQSFPESFILVGSDIRQYRAIGNAVPPVLMWHVTRAVLRAIGETVEEECLAFENDATNIRV
jgi:DNA (cytosine-5)-methyltransferase 1